MASPKATDLAIILGTRPEIIKLSPIIRKCREYGTSFSLIHTGQHYTETLNAVFFDQLQLPRPDYDLEIGSGTHGAQTGSMLLNIEEILLDVDPTHTVVQGDTNTTLAGGIVASKLDCKLSHVEAGLRSGDRGMPEEINRVLVDHASDYLFAPTSEAASILESEGIPGDRITVTGNTIVDAVEDHRTIAATQSEVLDNLNMEPENFILMTSHRAENVDEPSRFEGILEGVGRFANSLNLPVIYPIHPRAKRRLDEFGVSIPDIIRTISPLDFLDFLRLEMTAVVVFTDSGGVQEETCILGTPCVTLRNNTERPETIEVGSNILVGTNPQAINEGAETMLERQKDWKNPFGDGKAADRILEPLIE